MELLATPLLPTRADRNDIMEGLVVSSLLGLAQALEKRMSLQEKQFQALQESSRHFQLELELAQKAAEDEQQLLIEITEKQLSQMAGDMASVLLALNERLLRLEVPIVQSPESGELEMLRRRIAAAEAEAAALREQLRSVANPPSAANRSRYSAELCNATEVEEDNTPPPETRPPPGLTANTGEVKHRAEVTWPTKDKAAAMREQLRQAIEARYGPKVLLAKPPESSGFPRAPATTMMSAQAAASFTSVLLKKQKEMKQREKQQLLQPW